MDSEENMKVCVYGLGHLGTVTAACLAAAGHNVLGIDEFYPCPPEEEPDLIDMTAKYVGMGRLRWGGDLYEAASSDIIWVTFDTPVDENGAADVGYVLQRVRFMLNALGAKRIPIVISSQLPVGTIARIEAEYPPFSFYCIPENLRHRTAVENFLHPDRIVVGCRPIIGNRRRIFSGLLDKIVPLEKIQWMSTESAEMVKHAINAWMAMSICFANEIAKLCEKVGADPKEVEYGMRTEERIGQKAYIRPGGPYEGRTLARDLEYLREIAGTETFIPLLMSIPVSNDIHRLERGK
jgi:UDPglucose 6-dehydrogenase